MRRAFRYLLFVVILSGLSISSWASSGVEKKGVDVKEIIFSHLEDSYEWHITTIDHTHLTIHLPVIVRGAEGGWHVFSSSKLSHGEYRGFRIAGEGEPHEGKVVEHTASGEIVRPLDFSLTKNALALMINGLLLIGIVLSVARWYRNHPKRSVPKGFTGVFEMFTMDMHDNVIKPCIGPDYERYAPYLLTAFYFILINNLMALLPFFPGGASTTGNITVTMGMALFSLIAVNFWGDREYWKEIFWPDVPTWLKVPIPLMPAIELFGIFTKPFALMIRLFANMMAGHAVVLGFTCIIFVTASVGPVISSSMTVVSVLLSIFMYALDILISYIQAYVFMMLSAVFIGLSRQGSQHHKPETKALKVQ